MRHISRTWRMRLNLCFLRPTRIHNTNGESIGLAILHSSRQNVVGHAQACPFPNNCPFAWSIWTPSNTCFLGPIQATTQTASRSVQPFFAQMTVECPYTLQWDAPSPLKLPIPMGIWAQQPPLLVHVYCGQTVAHLSYF